MMIVQNCTGEFGVRICVDETRIFAHKGILRRQEMPPKPVPDIVISRLPIYLRALAFLELEKKEITSSQELSERLGFTSAQIRKDLSYFGGFGKQGTGYRIAFLKEKLQQILRIESIWEVLLVGAGDLGSALARYQGFELHGFRLVAIFDNAAKKIGTKIGGLEIQDIAELPRVARAKKLEIAIMAVPASEAQSVANCLVQAGIRAILNYAPITLSVPRQVRVHYIDPVVGLQSMTYYL
jgi:redox-sensing transcriptional repressor